MTARGWRGYWLIIIVLTSFGRPSLATAEPYCVANLDLPPQCIYVDPDQCRLAANRIKGYCVLNPTVPLHQAGISRYCVIEPDQSKSCLYPDQNSCNVQATRLHSVCVIAVPPPGPNEGIDPFRLVRP